MHKLKPHHRWILRRAAAFFAVVIALTAGCFWAFHGPIKAPAPPVVADSKLDFTLPKILSSADAARYTSLFLAQGKRAWSQADEIAATLDDKSLLGYALAERYLSRSYDSKPDELAAWLGQYNDLPQAADIHSLALTKGLKLAAVRTASPLSGYGDDAAPAAQGDSPRAVKWRTAIIAWQHDKIDEAAKLFSQMAKNDTDSAWQDSAAAFWAYRAYHRLGDKATADKYLNEAAEEPRSFYGILARRELHRSLDLDMKPIALSDSDILEIIGEPAIKRVIALSQIGQSELAEKELRALFPGASNEDKRRLLALAHQLNLASVQIAMAKQMGSDGHEMDFARYPIPNWQPEGGFTVEPALIYALMRQESGFRASAVSDSGALGLMQLMPKTASLMQKSSGTSGSAAEPTLNMTLGQNYVKSLLDNRLVDGNLIYLLTAYNAGPGRLLEWKQTAKDNDPLLFIESIPYAQTRAYVMQVMTNYWIYSELAGRPSQSIYALLHGNWPWYASDTMKVVAQAEPRHAG